MSRHRFLTRTLTALFGVLLSLTAVQVAAATTAAAEPDTQQARIVYYDASGAQEFVSAMHTAAALWNSVVDNVELVARSSASVRILADNGWPRAYVCGLGCGTIVMGREAVNLGYHVPRIATHELGHILGLPDRRTGLCSDLMSGSSAPVSCTNAYPSAAERAAVERNFGGFTAEVDAAVGVHVWRPAA